MRAMDATDDELHRAKYPSGAKVEIVNLADGQLMVVVKPPSVRKNHLTDSRRKVNTVRT
jgi:hypothetical protein